MFLNVKNISKKFKDLNVLNDVSFSVEKGEVVVLLGNSGAGKTTLLRCLNFLEKPDNGTIEIGGNQIYDASIDNKLSEKELVSKRLHFGLVFQNFNLFPQYTVKENISLAPKLLGQSDDLDARIDEILNQVGLTDKKDSYPYQLSGGQQQRVAIARALIMSPDILCFDEPTSALDPALVGEVIKVIKGLKDNGRTILIVTHDMSFAKRVSDRIIFMSGGDIVEDRPTEDFFLDPKEEASKEFLKDFVL